MDIFEIAAQLGKTLKEDERLVRLENAKKAYDASPDLGKMMLEYEVQQKALENEVVKPEKDMHFIDIIQNRINELYKSIMEHPVFVELNEAQQVVNELMNAVNSTITFNITGEIPSDCTHNCSTCGGGCHH
jgi:cell fate (sporulation/competence/biofilm development) regulator YlbF (YheA/YmcA/DUF963 family)